MQTNGYIVCFHMQLEDMAEEGEAAVRVAVRVRPFNGREKAMNAGLSIEMEGKKTTVRLQFLLLVLSVGS